jgi:hypothetical protein
LEPVKVVIFIGVFVLLLLLGRMLSSRAEVLAHEMPPPPEPEPAPPPLLRSIGIDAARSASAHAQYEPRWNSLEPLPDAPSSRRKPARTGAEIGFPFSVPPVTLDDKGKFNRPYYLNYYFKHLDLVDGPPNPTSFCDHFFMVYQDPATKHEWEVAYLVATPSGLRELMQKDNFESLYLDERTVIVRDWNLSLILRTILDEHIKAFGSEDDDPSQAEPPTVV